MQYDYGKALKEIDRLKNIIEAGRPLLDGREILQAGARGETVDHIQVYCAKVLYEREPLVIEGPKTDEDAEENYREGKKLITYFVKAGIRETLCQAHGRKVGSGGAPAWINPIVTELLREYETAMAVRPSEIVTPSPAPVVVRKRKPPQIDGCEDGYAAEEPVKAAETADGGRRPFRHRGKMVLPSRSYRCRLDSRGSGRLRLWCGRHRTPISRHGAGATRRLRTARSR